MPLTLEQVARLAEAWRDEGGEAAVRALVWAERVAIDGDMHVDSARSAPGPVPHAALDGVPHAGELGALLWLESASTEDRIVDALDVLDASGAPDSRAARATRVFTPYGVLDVVANTGLVIAALPPGVSAAELQGLSRATLKIAPTVDEVAPR